MVSSAKKLGIHTVRVIRGQYKNIKLNKESEADYQIRRLGELVDIMPQIKKSNR